MYLSYCEPCHVPELLRMVHDGTCGYMALIFSLFPGIWTKPDNLFFLILIPDLFCFALICPLSTIYSLQNSAKAKFWRRRSELNRCIRVLQTRALPLGYAASVSYCYIINTRNCQIVCT